jgi:RHS repeat-associated protein
LAGWIVSESEAAGVLSLPTGGGAVRGIGEKFVAELQSGTGNYSVPLELPPGRGGLVPNLALQYSSGSGNGPFGLGWSLSVPGVARQTARGVPRYGESDVFVLSGAEDLIAVPGAADGRQRYRPRTEGLFARIERDRAGGSDTWEVCGRDGTVSRYGTPGGGPRDPAVVADPADPTRVFAWRLTSTTDVFGNRIEYAYDRDRVVDGTRAFTQLYLSEIRYADHGDPAAPEFLVRVRFRYDVRPDPFADHRSGFEIRTRKRCSRIEVFTAAETERLTRTYELIYADDPRAGTPLEQLPANGASLLAQVRVVGHDGDVVEALPPLRLGYRAFEPQRRELLVVDSPDAPPVSLADKRLELVDITGDGLPDVLEMDGAVRFWRNRGGGTFERPRSMTTAPGFTLGQPGVQLLDADGDGRLDLMVTVDRLAGFFPLDSTANFDRRSLRRFDVAPSVDLADARVRLLDLTGDGVTDALRTGSTLECFFNHPRQGWHAARRLARRHHAVFPDVDFADPRVRVADLSGDGLADIALVTDRQVWYWPSLGYGDFGPRVVMGSAPELPPNHDPRRVLVGDVDGDGLADIVYLDDRRVTVWINQGGERFADPIEIGGTPRVADPNAVQLTDFLGVGTTGVLWTFDADTTGRPTMYFLDLTGEAKPYLLTDIDNGLGARTTVEYASSTRFSAARPAACRKTTLPFPVQVVTRVRSFDAVSDGTLTTEFTYRHGYWDGHEHEFRGFGRVDQRDTELIDGESIAPPTETRTWFHLGAIDAIGGGVGEADYVAEYFGGDTDVLVRPVETDELLASLPADDRRDALRALRGTALRREVYALDGSERAERPYSVVETLTGLREEDAPGPAEDGRQRVFFPQPRAERTTVWERGDDPLTELHFTDDYDAFGYARSEVSIAVPRGRDYRRSASSDAPPYLATLTRTSYAQRDDDRYLCDRIARTTTFEIVNDGSTTAFELGDHANAETAPLQVVADTMSFYDGDPFDGLALGELGDHGVLARQETLVVTEAMLAAAYGGDDAGIPPYLLAEQPEWTDDYPDEYRAGLVARAGYLARDRGLYAVTAANHYDCQSGGGPGLLLATRDPLGNQTAIGYDRYDLLPVRVTDPAGLPTTAAHDYRVLKVAELAEPNGSRSVVTFSPLGFVVSTSVIDEDGMGDTLDAPSITVDYDLGAYAERGTPVSVRTTRRVHHVGERALDRTEGDETIVAVEYSDGFGRLVQTRTQAERLAFGDDLLGQLPVIGPITGTVRPDRVVVSSWQIYDNKGQVVEKFEPFFDDGFDYAEPTASQLAQRTRLFYDPRGELVRTVNPDGSEQRVVLGVPVSLEDPDDYVPTPWERYTYDPNDNAGRTHPTATTAFASHWDTPSNVEVDTLGRVVRSVVRNGRAVEDELTTRSAFDILGNLVSVVDTAGRVAFRTVYDLAGRALRTRHVDAGDRAIVFDAAGNAIENRDARGALTLRTFDALNRPLRVFARDGADEPLTLRERIDYGDSASAGLDPVEAVAANVLGRVVRHFDEAGLVTTERYDFKGNPLETSRRTIADQAVLAAFERVAEDGRVPAFRVDWRPPDGTPFAEHASQLLDPTVHRTSSSYDALNRRTAVRYPAAVDGTRRELRAGYAASGALERVDLDGEVFVEHIAYNARGQRTLVAYGNGVLTHHIYDPTTFLLTTLRSERFTEPAAHTYAPTGAPLQDHAYGYDLAGNLRALEDTAPAAGVPGTPAGADRLLRSFDHDPLYRLIRATGRECAAQLSGPFDAGPRCSDPTLTREYTETYRYDSEGGLLSLRHANGGDAFTRTFATATGGTRVVSMTSGSATFEHRYDAAGNVVSEGLSRHFEWDHAGRLRVFRSQVDGSSPTVHAHYLYDAGGQRVKKVVRKQGRVETTVYVDGIFQLHRVVTSADAVENNTLHVMDDERRLAEVRVGSAFPDDATPAVKYHLDDHLHSSAVVLDASGSLVNREEFSPYGDTSFGSYARKRYRFTGKERDEESGLNYHGARYYAPWLARWTSPDPAGPVDGLHLYRYCRGNPVTLSDRTGTLAERADRDPPTDPTADPARPGSENLAPDDRGRPRALPSLTSDDAEVGSASSGKRHKPKRPDQRERSESDRQAGQPGSGDRKKPWTPPWWLGGAIQWWTNEHEDKKFKPVPKDPPPYVGEPPAPPVPPAGYDPNAQRRLFEALLGVTGIGAVVTGLLKPRAAPPTTLTPRALPKPPDPPIPIPPIFPFPPILPRPPIRPVFVPRDPVPVPSLWLFIFDPALFSPPDIDPRNLTG